METTSVDEIEVVTLEQLNKAIKASAKQAESNVMKGLRNMPARRGRAGVRRKQIQRGVLSISTIFGLVMLIGEILILYILSAA